MNSNTFFGLPNFIGRDTTSMGNLVGYNQFSDIPSKTTDGLNWSDLWNEFQSARSIQNAVQSTIVSLLSYPTTKNIERVMQVSSAEFEEASEFGEPVGIRAGGTYFNLGFTLKTYDVGARFTRKFLNDADAAQVRALNAQILDADNRLMFMGVMSALYSKVNRTASIDGQDVSVYALYNADGTVPPSYKTNTFDGTHTHYLTSGAATVDSQDLEDMYEHLRHHGYDVVNGVNHVLFVNSAEAKIIRTFKVTTGALYDFIPSVGSPAELVDRNVVLFGGSQPPSTFNGLKITGKYGNWLVVEDDMFPAGYMVGVGTGGWDNLINPVGIRQHERPELRGLLLVKGPDSDYPIIDSFYQRQFGTGIRQRGGSVIMKVTASATYTPPSEFNLL